MTWSGSQQNLNVFFSRGGAPCPKNRLAFVVNHSCYREARYEVEVMGLFPKTGPHIVILSQIAVLGLFLIPEN